MPQNYRVPVAAFDSKQFRRGKVILKQTEKGAEERYSGFNSQLGVGAIIKDEDQFVEKFLRKNNELKQSFEITGNLPFFSSNHLKQTIGLSKAIAYADQIITEIQGFIDLIHCSFVIIPPTRTPTIRVGGFKTPLVSIPTNQFIDNLGPMFSYLTAHSYLYINNYKIPNNYEMHIDAFRSFRTTAWEKIVSVIQPKVFWKGDECNPFIACADLLAFLTDAKLYDQRLKLEPNDIARAWNEYSFEVKVNFYDEKSLSIYSWHTKEVIDYKQFLAKPTIFLAIDEIEKPEYAEKIEEPLTNEIGVESETRVRKFHQVIKRTEVYYSAVNYAYLKNGSLKIFQKQEDLQAISDGDVFVYVGERSKKIGVTLQDAYDIELLSGLELRRKIKQSTV